MKTRGKKLNIAIVSDAVYPYNIGGKEKRIYEITKRLAIKGHKLTVYCMRWPDMENVIASSPSVIASEAKQSHARSNINPSPFTPNPLLKPISPYFPLYSGKRRSIKQAFFFSLFTFKLIKEDFDILDADHMPHLVLFPLKIVSIIKRKRFYVTWNEVWGRKYWVKYMGISGNIAFLIEWLSARLPDEIISISTHTTEKLKNQLKIKKPIHTVPAGIDLKSILDIKPSMRKSDIIFAGRFLKHKNIDYLIKSISFLKKTHPDIRCLIIGNGPEESRLKALSVKLNVSNNITFYDFLKNHEDLYVLMKSSKVFVFPSIREGFGIAVLEANACGIPAITINHKDNAAKDLIQDGENGYLVKLDEADLAEKIKLCLSKKGKFDYLKYVKEYDWDIIADRVEEVYRI